MIQTYDDNARSTRNAMNGPYARLGRRGTVGPKPYGHMQNE